MPSLSLTLTHLSDLALQLLSLQGSVQVSDESESLPKKKRSDSLLCGNSLHINYIIANCILPLWRSISIVSWVGFGIWSGDRLPQGVYCCLTELTSFRSVPVPGNKVLTEACSLCLLPSSHGGERNKQGTDTSVCRRRNNWPRLPHPQRKGAGWTCTGGSCAHIEIRLLETSVGGFERSLRCHLQGCPFSERAGRFQAGNSLKDPIQLWSHKLQSELCRGGRRLPGALFLEDLPSERFPRASSTD